MTNEIQILGPGEEPNLHRSEHDDRPRLGEWYWVKTGKDNWRDYEGGAELHGHTGYVGGERLMCVVRMGSNYVKVQAPEHHSNGIYSHRVHDTEYWTEMRHEPNAEAIIEGWARAQYGETQRIMGRIQSLCERLGMTRHAAIAGPAPETGTALVVMAQAPDISGYKAELVLAKETTLPELYKDVEASNGNLASLLKAKSLPALALVGDLRGTIADIDDRIFSISLYAGLTETAEQVADGEPAGMLDKLHVMQSMCFMDEECLAEYRHGGMEFKDIGKFDAWLADPVNRDRIMPFPKTMVAFRVRRGDKWREGDTMRKARVNFDLKEADKTTFLYLRNGDQLWRISTDLEFDEQIFPNRTAFDPSEKKYAEMFGSRVKGFIGESLYELLCQQYDEKNAANKRWKKEHPKSSWMDNPHRTWGRDDPRTCYVPVTPDNVFYDDAMHELNEVVKKYNRVAVIIQGLFDRSPVLQPHPKVSSWTAAGFERAITLVYDGGETLHHGDAPDFEAYRAKCNASLGVGSTVVGQEEFWLRKEAERENARRANAYSRYERDRGDVTFFRPEGNPGPGYMTNVEAWSKTKGATFRWNRERLRATRWIQDGSLPCTIQVPADKLFNVDAYQLGDFKRFFADRRTRAQYLQWAPMLIAAEEYVFARRKAAGEI